MHAAAVNVAVNNRERAKTFLDAAIKADPAAADRDDVKAIRENKVMSRNTLVSIARGRAGRVLAGVRAPRRMDRRRQLLPWLSDHSDLYFVGNAARDSRRRHRFNMVRPA